MKAQLAHLFVFVEILALWSSGLSVPLQPLSQPLVYSIEAIGENLLFSKSNNPIR